MTMLRPSVWPVVIAGTIAAVIAAVGHLGYGSAHALWVIAGGERLMVSPSIRRMGECRPRSEHQINLKVFNFSDRPARVVGGTSTCTCVTIEALPLDVAPRDSVDVPVTIRVSGDLGTFTQTVTLYVNSGDSVLQTLEAVVEADVGDDP